MDKIINNTGICILIAKRNYINILNIRSKKVKKLGVMTWQNYQIP